MTLSALAYVACRRLYLLLEPQARLAWMRIELFEIQIKQRWIAFLIWLYE
ncbi:MAG: hypothetical protein HUU30_18540 [Burkholderiaceae bacterium]|nr:hypothetical protein [Aquabacterium sp.]NUP87732.1 hypothetical protein [Burkholderiaceae bacterium]